MSDKNKILKFLIQVIGWGLVFGFPLFFTWKEGNPMTWVKFLGYVGVPIAFITVFYANYFIFIDRLLFRKRLLVFIIVNLFLFVLLSLCLHGWQEYYFIHFVNEGPRHSRPFPPRSVFIIRDGVMMALVSALSVAIRMTENWYILEQEKKELENARSEAELQNLKSQLNPHFLFNTLNNIYSLIAIDPDRAQFAVIQAAIEGVDAEIAPSCIHADVRGKAHGIRPMAAAVAVLAERSVFGHMPHAVLVRHMQLHGAEVRRAQHCPHLRTLAQRHDPLWPRRAAHVHIGQGQSH